MISDEKIKSVIEKGIEDFSQNYIGKLESKNNYTIEDIKSAFVRWCYLDAKFLRSSNNDAEKALILNLYFPHLQPEMYRLKASCFRQT